MKTIKLIVVLTLLSVLPSTAQITKGNWMVGGNLRFSHQKSESTSGSFTQTQQGTGLNIATNLGFFPIDKLAIGIVPTFGWNNPEGVNNSGFGIGIGPFLRYYFLKPENRINLFSHVEYKIQNGYRQGDKSNQTQNFNFKVGPAIFFNSSVALELTLEYEYGQVSSYSGIGSESKFNNFNIGVGFQIHLEK